VHSELPLNSLLNQQAEGKIYAITGVLATNNEAIAKTKNNKTLSATTGAEVIIEAKRIGKVKHLPKQVYVYLPLTGETKLVWSIEIEYGNGGLDFGRDIFFFDIDTLAVVTRFPQINSAKNWKTYDLQNQSQSSAPGVLKCTNNQTCGDASAQRAHDGAAKVYDYYKTKFSRNGIDNNDMTMISSVHLGNNVANAYWSGTQMMYGDGDGQILADLTLSFDVVGHELTHGVTQNTANLAYKNASGALNEAWSDIMGVSAAAYRNATLQPDWRLAKEA